MGNSTNILLIEDDESLNRGITFKLKKEGYNVFSATCLKEGRDIFNEQNIDLIILDIGLPDGDGFEFCKETRETSDVLIIFLTACDEEIDIVTGYDLGADDYVIKPFSLMVLMSKINAVIRRNSGKKEYESIVSKEITYYPNTMKVFKNEKELSLTKTEFKLFKYFITNPQHIITKEQFLNKLWDIEGNFIDDNTIAVNMRRLREKIEDDPSTPTYIQNVRGIGYMWSERCIKK